MSGWAHLPVMSVLQNVNYPKNAAGRLNSGLLLDGTLGIRSPSTLTKPSQRANR